MDPSPHKNPHFHSAYEELLKILWNSRLITVFTRAWHWSLTWARRIPPILAHSISLKSNLILSSHQHPLLPSGLCSLGFLTKTLCVLLFYSLRVTCPTYLNLPDLITLIIYGQYCNITAVKKKLSFLIFIEPGRASEACRHSCIDTAGRMRWRQACLLWELVVACYQFLALIVPNVFHLKTYPNYCILIWYWKPTLKSIVWINVKFVLVQSNSSFTWISNKTLSLLNPRTSNKKI
jgi:hypothetical protein